jgi:hypothetical protein
LDKIYDLEKIIEDIDKEKIVLQLEYTSLKNEMEKINSEK